MTFISQENVLVSDTGSALLCDFGIALLASQTEGDMHGKSTHKLRKHSKYWMAKELFETEEPATLVSKPADMWAFAITAVEVSHGPSVL